MDRRASRTLDPRREELVCLSSAWDALCIIVIGAEVIAVAGAEASKNDSGCIFSRMNLTECVEPCRNGRLKQA